ncbi:chemotaxis protein CheW [Frigidibacter mobilis]|uniref:Chemotaxis protein CheW n=1 Tax=Frigidibacter mobilis TaxID=1335048 RepID=A0A159Z8E1_9RHOB|nr:chemotaxis protein CheW [Frigidibacter mobilis]AMY70958.1 chemotaxis protein CheW [Frigidibacter mobilis]
MTATAALADPWSPDDAEAVSEPQTYVTFELSGQVFAVAVAHVREILDMQPIARLPNAPSDLLGMIDVRGEGIAVIDLAARLGLMGGMAAEEGRIVVFEFGADGSIAVGVIADRVLSVVEIRDSEIETAPSALTRWDASVLRGVSRVAGRLTLLLALDELFGKDAQDPFDFT